MFKRVDYLEKLEDAVLFDLMFNLEAQSNDKNDVILDPSKESNTMYFVEDGILEVYTRFEGTSFVLE